MLTRETWVSVTERKAGKLGLVVMTERDRSFATQSRVRLSVDSRKRAKTDSRSI